MDSRYYKIVSPDTENYLSSCIVFGPASIEYIPDQWVVAPSFLAVDGYHLTVFSTLDNARKFIIDECGAFGMMMQIWEVEVEGVLTNLPPVRSVTHVSTGTPVRSVAHASTGTPGNTFPGAWPPGTAMAKKVMLKRRV